MNLTLRLHPDDNIAIALTDLQIGEGDAAAAIPRGHKMAAVDLAEGRLVRRYGQVIGVAS